MQIGQLLVRWGSLGDNVRLRQAPPRLHDKVAASNASYEGHKVSGSQRTPHVALSVCTRGLHIDPGDVQQRGLLKCITDC